MNEHQVRRRRLRDSEFWQSYMERRYAILFAILLLMMVALPVASTLGLPQLFMKLVIAASLFAAIMPNATRGNRRILFVTVILLVVFQGAADSPKIPVNTAWAIGLIGLAGLLSAAAALRFVMRADRVDGETICAALSAYLLAGIFFGQIHWSIESTWPGSYTPEDALSASGFVYYSFVTLATLGYGDILPKSDLARGVATLEVVGGQLFLAVTLARLVGLAGSTKRAAK